MSGWYIVHGTGIRIYHKGLYAELSYWFFSKIKVFKITARTALKAISLKSQKQADHTEATQ